jgi:hypothetical protein
LGEAVVIVDRLLDRLRGKAVTIPPMDGALRPNTRLDEARVVVEAPAADNLVLDGARILYSSGGDLFALPSAGGAPGRLDRFAVPITALAAAPDGGLAIGLDDGRIILRAAGGERTLSPDAFADAACPTALAFAGPTTLLVCQGSTRCRASDWVVDLMRKNSAGSLWRVDLVAGQASCLAGDLAFPYGLLVEPGGRAIVAESWRHRLLAVPADGGPPQPVLGKLPGYPARLCPAADGGAWLALFAPRNRLIEFTLLEDDYRADMMREIPREYWIAPALASGASFLEPLQCGGVRTMGIHKPWSPTRSYGLVLRLDQRLQPVASLHSRANGTRHGVTSLVEAAGELLAASKGGNAILAVGRQAGEAGPA